MALEPVTPTTGTISDWIPFLDRVDSLEVVRRHTERMLDRLIERGGRRVLDVGCGVGHDVLRLGRRVGATGRVVGVDTSERLVAEAGRRVSLGNCDFELADGRELPFADGSFDAARIDRVLHWYSDPVPFVEELVRVVRPGGAVMLSEPDVRSLRVAGVDDTLLEPVRALCAAGPCLGARHLEELLAASGVGDIESRACACAVRDCEMAVELFDPATVAARARSAGRMSPMQVFALQVAAGRARRSGTFAVSLTGNTVLGVKRPTS